MKTFLTIDSVERFKGKKLKDVRSEISNCEYTDEEAAAIIEESKQYVVSSWGVLEGVTGYTYHTDGEIVGDYGMNQIPEKDIVVCDGHFCGITGARGAVVDMHNELLLIEDGVKVIGVYAGGGDEWDADITRYGELIKRKS